MRLIEFVEQTQLNEFGGRHGYGGEGNGYFQQRFYVYIADALHDVHDAPAREYLTNWFVGLFKSDNSRFKESVFRAAVETGIHSNGSPQFQQRHFYYMAHHIKAIADEHIREFVCNWLGGVIGSTNPQFQPMRWRQFCGLPMTPEQEQGMKRTRTQYR